MLCCHPEPIRFHLPEQVITVNPHLHWWADRCFGLLEEQFAVLAPILREFL
jgi:hypothetical protein